MNYLNKFSPSPAKVCEPLRRPTSMKREWTWNKNTKTYTKGQNPLLGKCMNGVLQ